jgi:hypothetical protein
MSTLTKDLIVHRYYKHQDPVGSPNWWIYFTLVQQRVPGQFYLDFYKTKDINTTPWEWMQDVIYKPDTVWFFDPTDEIPSPRCPGDPSAKIDLKLVTVHLDPKTGKPVKLDNRKNVICLQCGNPTKEIVLVMNTTRYCPKCEP